MSLLRSSYARARRAFTLVELVVVIVVLLILMAIAVPAFLTMRDSSRDTSALSNLNVAYRTVAAFGAGADRYADDTAAFATRMAGAERAFAMVAAPAVPPAAGDVQVSLADDGRTAHMCTVSATGTSFCVATNLTGALETNSPFVSNRAVFRSWGHTLAAASCWLPTEEDGPGERCADADTRELGGAGTKPSGDAPGGDLGAGAPIEDTADTIPPVGFEGAASAIPEVGAEAPLLRMPVATAFAQVGTAGPRSGFATDDDGNVYRAAPGLERLDVATQTMTTVIPVMSHAAPPSIGDDTPASESHMVRSYGMTWGGGRLWFIDHYANHSNTYLLRVYNPATGRVATVANAPNTGNVVVAMAYMPAEGAMYLHTNSRYSELYRIDIASGEITTVAEPGGWQSEHIAYDHVTKRLLLGGADSANVLGVASFDPRTNTLQRIAGGNTDPYAVSHGDPPADKVVASAMPIVTHNGTILLVESSGIIPHTLPYGTPVWKTWVRQLDRSTGNLTVLYSNPAQAPEDPEQLQLSGRVTIGGDGHMYLYNWSGSMVERVSLLP